jgi:uncharacterized C2H2 Zn-finger protein
MRPMPGLWTCPKCGRVFRRPKQTHSCHTGSRSGLTADRPEELVKLYTAMEKQVRSWNGVEIVISKRCALFRTTRIFADMVFMTDALRLALLLDREAKDPIFFKTGRMSTNRVAHVTLIRTAAQLRAALPYLREAHGFAIRDARAVRATKKK